MLLLVGLLFTPAFFTPYVPLQAYIAPTEVYLEEYDVRCYCVAYLREVKEIPIRGNAEDIIPNVDHPLVGGVVLINYGGIAHAGLIQAILPSGAIYMESANRLPCQVTNDVISQDDPRIRGFWFRNLNTVFP